MDKKNSKMGRPPPQWVYNLEDGEYTCKDLVRISGTTPSSVRSAMTKYSSYTRYEIEGQKIIAIYTWDSSKFHKNYPKKDKITPTAKEKKNEREGTVPEKIR